jgi:hypothetical protein
MMNERHVASPKRSMTARLRCETKKVELPARMAAEISPRNDAGVIAVRREEAPAIADDHPLRASEMTEMITNPRRRGRRDWRSSTITPRGPSVMRLDPGNPANQKAPIERLGLVPYPSDAGHPLLFYHLVHQCLKERNGGE